MGNYVPVIVIGAGRSGTNMLRDMLTQLPGFGTWPCDEINYIWRHGNRAFPTDEFSVEMARPEVVQYIRRAFDRLAARENLGHVVEKTCANSLRVGFVHRVVPEARFIHIVRDGRDVAASAAQRWTAPLDVPYLLRKARFVPPSDLPYYGGRYLLNRVARLRSSEKKLATWGPRFERMQEVLATQELPVACALQWQRCVEAADAQLAALPSEQVIQVRYESFVTDPAPELDRIVRFLEYPVTEDMVRAALAVVRVGKQKSWRNTLGEDMGAKVSVSVGATLYKFGYETD